jgi:hypothetical protein
MRTNQPINSKDKRKERERKKKKKETNPEFF